MNSIIRLAGICPCTPPLRPMETTQDILRQLDRLDAIKGAGIVLLPRRALCPPSCDALVSSKTVLCACEDALSALIVRSRDIEGFLVLTTLFAGAGKPCEEVAVIHRGECRRFPAAPVSAPVFSIGDVRFAAAPARAEELPFLIPQIAALGCSLLLVPCYEPVRAGSIGKMNETLRLVSAAAGCGVLCVNGGVGDTSSPDLYQGFCTYAENGEILAHMRAGMTGDALVYDADSDVVPPARTGPPATWSFPNVETDSAGLKRPLHKYPYLPAEEPRRSEYLDELFALQTRSLASRLSNTGMRKMVLGVSGGLDSTLALLCCASVCTLLDLPREEILAVTMPGFGTSDRTYFNALQLIELLGCQSRDISIAGAVTRHFEDIGHDPAQRDSTYENAQARERTQILFDLANACGGLVVGTGDLSEAALGFSTFGGDHLAGYNVNICLNKTTIRALVRRLADIGRAADVSDTLRDILDTPVSPELLPPDESGAVRQKSEEILGPYELHDFFLYYTLRYQFTPQKLYGYAAAAFAGAYSPAFIEEKLRIFLRRFYTAQFKRSCSPDAARIAEPNLIGWQIPSDLNAQLFLDELK